jgi:hypothetical protein
MMLEASRQDKMFIWMNSLRKTITMIDPIAFDEIVGFPRYY